MRPEQIAQCRAPAFGLAVELEQTLLLTWRITPPGGLDLDLALQGYILNIVVERDIAQAQFEQQQRRRRIARDFDRFDFEN